VAQSIKAALRSSASSFADAGVVFPCYGALAKLSVRFASVASDQRGINDGGLNQWIRVKVTSWSLEIHRSQIQSQAVLTPNHSCRY